MFEATTPADRCSSSGRPVLIGGVDFCRAADFCGPLRGLYPFPHFRMETKKKPTPAKEAKLDSPANERSLPINVFRMDDVSASVFRRDYNGRTFYSVSFSRSYKSASGEWRYTKNFDREDLGKIVSLCQQAAEYIDRIAGDGQTKTA
jgi:hypothetical protein